MFKFLFSLAVVLAFPCLAWGAPAYRGLTATQTGLNGSSLSATPVSSSVDMCDTFCGSELTFLVVVTPGTTTQMDVQCQESTTAAGTYSWIPFCSSASASTCATKVLSFDTSGSGTQWSIAIKPRAQFVRCQFDDGSDGTGTVVATAAVVAP